METLNIKMIFALITFTGKNSNFARIFSKKNTNQGSSKPRNTVSEIPGLPRRI
jgi:hypothetical protein